MLASLAFHAGVIAVAAHWGLGRGPAPVPPSKPQVLVIHPPSSPPPLNFVPEPPTPLRREPGEPDLPQPDIRPDDDLVLFDPARPPVVVAAEPLSDDPLPAEILILRVPSPSPGPAGAAAPASFTEPREAAPLQIDYPAAARRRGYEGAVVLEVTVDAAGAVATIRVAESSGHPVLDEAALRGFERARFEPARRNGIPVTHTFRQTVRFALRERGN